jgi:hypothetical protein
MQDPKLPERFETPPSQPPAEPLTFGAILRKLLLVVIFGVLGWTAGDMLEVQNGGLIGLAIGLGIGALGASGILSGRST